MTDVDELTAIFKDVSQGETTSTEHQDEQRGSWGSKTDADQQIGSIIEEMRERYSIETQLSTDQLIEVVNAFFDRKGDSQIARQLGDSGLDKTVRRARIALHLFHDRDTSTEFNLDELQRCLEAGGSGADCGREVGISASTANMYRRILRAREKAEAVDYMYHKQFEQYANQKGAEADVTDVDIEPDFDTGLGDAIADAGTDNPQLK